MTKKDYLQDISEIKEMMHKSTRFMSLSGLSGILAGIYAIAGGAIANKLIIDFIGAGAGAAMFPLPILELILIVIALVVALLAVITAYILTKRKAKKNGEKMWGTASKQLLKSFLIPLITGGLFALLLIHRGYYGLVAPVALIFYGLALINASKYTLSWIYYLGILEVLLGLLAFYFFGNGLLFWVLGFGVLHIVYGLLMYFKTDSNKA